jgi:short-subunit dehydrogenase
MSKHAMEAFTDSLAAEMEKFNVKVSIIEPGGFSSKIGKTTYERMIEDGFNVEDSLYKEEWEENWLLQSGGKIDIENDVPEEITKAVIDTLEADAPKTRYMVVGSRDAAVATVRKAMEEMAQLNEDQKHSLSRDELIAMLDELLGDQALQRGRRD